VVEAVVISFADLRAIAVVGLVLGLLPTMCVVFDQCPELRHLDPFTQQAARLSIVSLLANAIESLSCVLARLTLPPTFTSSIYQETLKRHEISTNHEHPRYCGLFRGLGFCMGLLSHGRNHQSRLSVSILRHDRIATKRDPWMRIYTSTHSVRATVNRT
jgi:hypothetical protein